MNDTRLKWRGVRVNRITWGERARYGDGERVRVKAIERRIGQGEY